MSELKEQLKEKTFVISPLVLKEMVKQKLSSSELVLILYFINVKNFLDLEDIKNRLGMDESEILNAFNNLITKKIIEVIMKKENGNIVEYISLDLLYDKIILNKEKKEVVNTDIYSCFENEFGRTLSPIEYETISNWVYNKVPEDTIKKALKEAVLSGVSNLRYIDKIINNWTNEKKDKEEYKELFDYDWLGDNND